MRKSISVIAATVAVICGLYCWSRSDILFEKQLSRQHRLVVRERASAEEGRVVLYVTYHNPPTIGMFGFGEQVVEQPDEPFSFEAIADRQSGVICVYDKNNVGFLLMFDPETGDLWDSTGTSGLQHTLEEWQLIFSKLRAHNPDIPYHVLPTCP